MSITRDFIRGEKGENMVAHILNSVGLPCQNVGKTALSSHDLEFTIGDFPFTIEVKNDEMAQHTGNMAIELWNPRRNEASGLTVTKADLWVQIIGDEVYVASTHELREWVDSNSAKGRYIPNAGDGNAAILVFPLHVILPACFSRIDNVDARTCVNTIEDLLS